MHSRVLSWHILGAWFNHYKIMIFGSRRKKLVERTTNADMLDYLQHGGVDKKACANEVEYLVVDLEMTGLDYKHDKILSIGYMPIIDKHVAIDQAEHHLIYHEDVDLDQTASIHGIHHADLLHGEDERLVMKRFLEALKGRVVVFHNARLDMAFLQKLSLELYDVELYVNVIDTMLIELKRNSKSASYAQLPVRLDDCRERYNLPRYSAHNAAIDALATAELWLAQMEYLSSSKSLPLKFYLNYK